MKTKVLTLNHHHLLLPLNINISPWINPKLTRSSTSLIRSTPTRRTLKLKAESKGFGRSEDITTRKKPNNNKRLEMKDVDRDDKIPDVVFERIIGRILLYVGAPLGTGLALLVVFQVLKEKQLWDAPIWVPALTTFITFGASTLGVAYGALSTSWDPNNKGSILGIQEARQNWDDMWIDEE